MQSSKVFPYIQQLKLVHINFLVQLWKRLNKGTDAFGAEADNPLSESAPVKATIPLSLSFIVFCTNRTHGIIVEMLSHRFMKLKLKLRFMLNGLSRGNSSCLF